MFRITALLFVSFLLVLGFVDYNGSLKSFSAPPSGLMVVDVHADWCPGCKNIAPALSKLRKDYEGKVRFVTFDVTNAQTKKVAAARAQKLGLSDWYEANRSKTSLVTIFQDGKPVKTFMNEANFETYNHNVKHFVNSTH